MRGILYFLSQLRYLSVVTTAPNLVMALAPLHYSLLLEILPPSWPKVRRASYVLRSARTS